MERLNDDAILTLLTSMGNFEDVTNLCKTSSRVREVCKDNKDYICKSILRNMGYATFINGSPCKILLELKKGERLNSKVLKGLLFGKKKSKDADQYVHFLAINGKLDKRWLYTIAGDIIMSGKLDKLEKLHKLTGYDFRKGIPGNQTLSSIAASWASNSKDLSLLKFMLSNGGSLDELDSSEPWSKMYEEFRDYPDGVPSRLLIGRFYPDVLKELEFTGGAKRKLEPSAKMEVEQSETEEIEKLVSKLRRVEINPGTERRIRRLPEHWESVQRQRQQERELKKTD